MARDGYRTMRMAEGTAAMLTRLAGEYELTYTRMADAMARGWDLLTDGQKMKAIKQGRLSNPKRRPGPRAKKSREVAKTELNGHAGANSVGLGVRRA